MTKVTECEIESLNNHKKNSRNEKEEKRCRREEIIITSDDRKTWIAWNVLNLRAKSIYAAAFAGTFPVSFSSCLPRYSLKAFKILCQLSNRHVIDSVNSEL